MGRTVKLIKCLNATKQGFYGFFSVAVVVAFFVQWAPFHAQRLITSYVPTEKWTPALIKFQSDLFYVSGNCYISIKYLKSVETISQPTIPDTF